jgi:hypothetical protein
VQLETVSNCLAEGIKGKEKGNAQRKWDPEPVGMSLGLFEEIKKIKVEEAVDST